ncbi:MAG: diguanylate cyclase [Proteobacteria bacterium]|nr:diguanylate cyclase [Pseudomonadota bacterium]
MPHPPRQPSLALRHPWWWLALAWLLLGALLVADLWRERQRIEARERALLVQQAGVLHDNLGQQLDAINHALSSLLADMESAGGRTGEGERLSERLRTFADAMPAVRTFNLLDAKGRVLASNFPEIVGRDLSHRDYFQSAARSRSANALIMGAPLSGVLGGWVLVLGRIVPGHDGGFGGMLVAGLDTQHFQTLLQSVRYAPDMLAGLTHGDGLNFLALGRGAEPVMVDLAQPDTLFTRHMTSGEPATVLRGVVRPGGEQYLTALRTVQPPALQMDRPLVVEVGRPWSHIFADWSAQARTLGLAYLLAGLAAAAVLLWVQRRQRQLIAQTQRLEDVQRRHQDMLHRLVARLSGVLYQYQLEPDGRSHFPYLSPGVADIYGYAPEELRDSAAPVLERIHPDDLQPVTHSIQESARTLADWRSEYRVILPGRGERWLNGQARPQRLDNGAVLWHGYIHDITDIKRQALQLQETERVLQQLMSDMPVGLCMVDGARRIYFRNRRFLAHFGYAEAEVPTLHEWALRAYPDADYRAEVAHAWGQAMAQAASQGGVIEARPYRVTARDGTQHVMDIGGLLFGGHFLATFQDRTEQQAHSERLHRLAYVDGLTNIANRRHFDQALQAEWRRCRRSGQPLAVMLLDIDYFKQYNDLYGHQQGDACLQAVAQVLRNGLARAHDFVARYGGEEFVCLLPECDAAGALHKAEALCRAVQALGMEHAKGTPGGVVTISIGVASQVPGAEGHAEDLLRQADTQLYRAKSDGRNRACGDGPDPLNS